MRKIRTLIVDDEPIARRGIRMQLRAEPDIDIVGECANGREAVTTIKRETPDLVFLDIQMPLLDGFGVVEELGVHEMPAVVFVTAFDEHAIRAFEINALDYLLKPIDRERFQKTLARSRSLIAASSTEQFDQKLTAMLRTLEESRLTKAAAEFIERLAVKEKGRVFFVRVAEIDWIDAQGNYVRIHARGESHLIRETMDRMESKLDPQSFLRIRRSTIVRVSGIKEMQPLFNGEFAVILKNGAQLNSSRRYRKNMETLLKF